MCRYNLYSGNYIKFHYSSGIEYTSHVLGFRDLLLGSKTSSGLSTNLHLLKFTNPIIQPITTIAQEQSLLPVRLFNKMFLRLLTCHPVSVV